MISIKYLYFVSNSYIITLAVVPTAYVTAKALTPPPVSFPQPLPALFTSE